MRIRLRSVGFIGVMFLCACLLLVINRGSVRTPTLAHIDRNDHVHDGDEQQQNHQQQKLDSSSSTCAPQAPPQTVIVEREKIVVRDRDSVSGDGDSSASSSSSSSSSSSDSYESVEKTFMEYYHNSQQGAKLREQHGALKIAAFSRLWVPPLHGKGGMQYHAMHLYSRLVAFGHTVHVFVTGPPHTQHKILSYHVDPNTLHLKLLASGADDGKLVLHQVASDHNSEYSETWYHNTLEVFTQVNKSIGGFHVAHSESWAGVPNVYQIGLQMAVTWHGSMLDWFRNEMNLIVHNFRMKGTMTTPHHAQRMKDLGVSVAYETYALLTVPHHIVISDSAYNDLVAINLLEKDRVHMIYNGVNEGNFRPNRAARAQFLKKHGIENAESVFVVGCGGRLEGIKGHHQMSKAMATLMAEKPNVVLLVAGTGAEAHRYEALKAKGLGVHMLGMMPQNDLAAFYQSLDVFVDPFYQHHGLNTVMIEATLSGVPLIATRLASAQTTVPSNAFGRTFGLGLIRELVDAIKSLMENESERAAISKNVHTRSTHLFTSTVMANSYETLLYNMYLHPQPLYPTKGNVVCKRAYPAMCYREP